MTAIVMLRAEDRVTIGSDGAVCDLDGRLISLASKVVLLPEYGCVIGYRGAGGFHRFLGNAIDACPAENFEDLAAALPDVMRATWEWFRSVFPDHPGKSFAIAIAGWSAQREKFELYRSGSAERQIEGIAEEAKPFEIVPIENDLYCAPLPQREQIERLGITFETSGPEDDMGLAIKIIAANRASRHRSLDDPEAGAPQHNVGGFIQLTTLFAGGISTQIVHRWRDRMGELIEPQEDPLG